MRSLGDGLLLRVGKSGSASFIHRIQVQGKRRDIALGSAKYVSLATARKMAFENKARVALGMGGPIGITSRQVAARSPVPTFAQFAAENIAERAEAGEWKRKKQRRSWQGSMDKWAVPIAAIPVDCIRRADVLAVMNQPVNGSTFWIEHNELAKTVLRRIGSILNVAVARELIPSSPASSEAICAALPKVNGRNGAAKRKHFAAIPYGQLGGFLRSVRKRPNRATALATEFMILTASRQSEVTGAKWSEFDIGARAWTVPSDRMKTNRDHCVMLSSAAVAVLRQAAELRDHSGFVFPGRAGKPVSVMTVRRMFDDTGATAHGCRSAFADWAAENCPDVPSDVVEAALSHVLGSKVRQSYLRTTLEEQRRELMDRWANFLAGSR